MGSTISFPGLGIDVTVNRVAFTLFGWEFYWYGVLIAFGALLAVWYAYTKAEEFGLDWDKAVDIVLVATICSILGARIYYIIFSAPGEFTTFRDIIDLRRGGVAFYGAVIGAFVSAALVCRLNGTKIRPLADLGAIGFLIGQGIGRWGNFVNQEAFGNNTSLPWGMTSNEIFTYLKVNQSVLEIHGMKVDPVMPVHPTFLYESLWCLLGVLLFTMYIKKRKFDGEIFLMYLAWNGACRGVIEGLRTDSLYIGNIRISQLLAIAGCVLSIGAIVYFRLRIKKARVEDPDFAVPYGHTEQCKIDMQELKEIRERIEKEKKEKSFKLYNEDLDEDEEVKEEEEVKAPKKESGSKKTKKEESEGKEKKKEPEADNPSAIDKEPVKKKAGVPKKETGSQKSKKDEAGNKEKKETEVYKASGTDEEPVKKKAGALKKETGSQKSKNEEAETIEKKKESEALKPSGTAKSRKKTE